VSLSAAVAICGLTRSNIVAGYKIKMCFQPRMDTDEHGSRNRETIGGKAGCLQQVNETCGDGAG
jgi:hypothetical protein